MSLNHCCYGFQEAECEKARMDTKYAADTKIANSKRQFEMQKANFDMEVNAKVDILCKGNRWFGILTVNCCGHCVETPVLFTYFWIPALFLQLTNCNWLFLFICV